MSFINDIASEFKKLKQDRKDLRNFAITMFVALAIIGGLMFFLGKHPIRAYWAWGIGGVFLIWGFVAPMTLKFVYQIWMGLAFVLGWFVSRIILLILFYGVVTPIALLMKLLRKDLLHQKLDRNAASYWIRREEEPDPKKYEKLF